ncbi:MAG: diguanylate cyclase [Proteobacteria bacterium]|nr:diguanylate cyclase [Pseudomonadota bacterium]
MASARSFHLFGRAADASTVPMLLVDVLRHDHPIIHCNAAFCSFTGYAEAEVLGRNCRFLQGEDLDQPGSRQLSEAVAQGRAARIMLRNYKRDGTLFYNELNIAPLAGDDGRVSHYFGVLRDVSEQIAIEEQLRELASTDPLTGLLNRRRFEGLVNQEILRSTRYARPMVALMFDLDHFKRVNDNHGHACGDAVLVGFAACLSRGLRVHDICARVGGEEFAAMLPETPIASGLEVAERLRRSVEAMRTPAEGGEIAITTSVGITQLTPWDDSYTSMIERADAALYASKQRGRNRVTVA